jgi:hypothetical protein
MKMAHTRSTVTGLAAAAAQGLRLYTPLPGSFPSWVGYVDAAPRPGPPDRARRRVATACDLDSEAVSEPLCMAARTARRCAPRHSRYGTLACITQAASGRRWVMLGLFQ